MNNLPTGTVTFLFTDIEGSTKLAQQYPDAMPTLLARHHAILREAIQAHRGVVFKVIGDAFCAAFPTAVDALLATVSAQRTLQHEPWTPATLKVRMGLNSGSAQPELDGDRLVDYTGYLTLTRVQRVMSVTHGGQVLLSNPTAELVRGDLPANVTLRDMGEHRLKSLVNLEHLWQMVAPDLVADFPPLQSLNAIPNNLPTHLTSFIGREKELARIQDKLTDFRLITLTGSGGVGKTRLSLQIAAKVIADFAQGVWFVELAPLADPALVPQAVMTTLNLQEDARRTPLTVLTDYLYEKTVLLVLDNCEHVIDACAQLTEQLLMHCPNVRILASSREALGVEGEVAIRVSSLSLPPIDTVTPEAVTHSEAAQLFIERAASALPSFVLTANNASAIAQVCRRLDGVALAIELAASRVKVLQVEQIADRLDDAFRLLTGGRRTALPRQQTLRATIDWSYNLLSDVERTLLRRLAVFAGGAMLEAVETICSDNDLESLDVLDVLTQLVNKSLVVAEREQGAETRYHLLETIRQYAREKLNDSGDGEAVREWHTRWYVELSECAEPKLHGHGQLEWLDRLEQEHDNLRAALEWSANNNVELGLQIASAVQHFWALRGHAVEGFQHMEKLLAVGPLDSTLLHAKALACAGWLAVFTNHEERAATLAAASTAMSRKLDYVEGLAFSLFVSAILPYGRGDYDQALPLAEESLALFKKADIKWGIREALGPVGYILQAKGDYERARAIYQESLALSREIGDIEGIGWSLYLLGGLAFEQTHYDQALAFYEESLSVEREAKSKPVTAWIIRQMGDIAMMLKHYSQAKALFEESIVLNREMGDDRRVATALNRLGRVARLQGEYEPAAKFYTESLQLAQKNDDRQKIAWCLADLAELAALRNQPKKAACLWGAAEALPELHIDLWPDERLELEQIASTIRAHLDEADFKIEQEAGGQMMLDKAIAYALEERD